MLSSSSFKPETYLKLKTSLFLYKRVGDVPNKERQILLRRIITTLPIARISNCFPIRSFRKINIA